jgi:hypothetical protein
MGASWDHAADLLAELAETTHHATTVTSPEPAGKSLIDFRQVRNLDLDERTVFEHEYSLGWTAVRAVIWTGAASGLAGGLAESWTVGAAAGAMALLVWAIAFHERARVRKNQRARYGRLVDGDVTPVSYTLINKISADLNAAVNLTPGTAGQFVRESAGHTQVLLADLIRTAMTACTDRDVALAAYAEQELASLAGKAAEVLAAAEDLNRAVQSTITRSGDIGTAAVDSSVQAVKAQITFLDNQ